MLARGHIIIIKRDGRDGSIYPVTKPTCFVGRGHHNDIKIRVKNVSHEHCEIITSEFQRVRRPDSSKALHEEMAVVTCFDLRAGKIIYFTKYALFTYRKYNLLELMQYKEIAH
jgi:hypothetical protein